MADQDEVTKMAELLAGGHPSASDLVAAAEMLRALLNEIEYHEERNRWR